MKIRELTQKAENLIEQGENAKQRQIHYQQQANSARAQVMSAYARLEAAASETDEEGNPIGDVSGARAEVYAAQALLESAEVNLAEANQQLEIVGRRKLDAVHEIERYENVEEGNMSKLAELQKKRFGANANAFMADLAARMNSGEQARQQLLHSMGMSSPGKSYSAGGVSGSAGGVAGTGSSGVGDVAASNTYGFAPAMLSHRDRIKWDYSQRAYAIWNNSNLSTSEKATLLRTEREKMQSELDLYDEKNSVPIMAKTRGGNTATKSFSAAERYEQLKADYCEDVGKILNDSSLNNSQKLAMIYDLQQKYSDTLVDVVRLVNQQYGNELFMSYQTKKPLTWKITKASFAEDNFILYEGYKLEYTETPLSSLLQKVQVDEYYHLSPYIFAATSPAGQTPFVGIGNILGIEAINGLSLLDSEIVTALPVSAFATEFEPNDLLGAIKRSLNTDCYCFSPEDLIAALNRQRLSNTVAKRRRENKCIFCGKSTVARIACKEHLSIASQQV